MNRVRAKLAADLPELAAYFQTGGLVDSIVNLGLPAPIDIQVSGNNMREALKTSMELAKKIKELKTVGDVLIPQDLDYPGIQLNVEREMASRLGLSSKETVDNVITERHDRSELLGRSQQRQ
jgi:Cu/Ag efflux pump CusA